MITITLPDASTRQFPQPVTVAEVATSIGEIGRASCRERV